MIEAAIMRFKQSLNPQLRTASISKEAQMALADASIKPYAGVHGSADKAAQALAEGSLDYDADARCDCHEHHGGDCRYEHCAEHQCREDLQHVKQHVFQS